MSDACAATVQGPLNDPGINQRALQELFTETAERGQDWNFTITVSVLEIYNETIRSVLPTQSSSWGPDPQGHSSIWGPVPQGCSLICLGSCPTGHSLICLGSCPTGTLTHSSVSGPVPQRHTHVWEILR